MELQTSDFESSLNSIGNFVQAVLSGQDENKKTKLVEQLNQFLEMACPSVSAKKISNNFDSKIPDDKKIKLVTGRMDVPNELWTKVMNYLPTHEIFKNFRLVCKRFDSLTSGIKYLNGKITDAKMSDIVLKIVKNSRTIIALDFEIVKNWYKFEKNFINEAINSCQRLKSLKISGNCELKMDVIEILKQFGTQFEHLAFENLNTTQEVLVEIGKLKFLKSLSLKSLNVKNISQSDQHSEMMVGIFQNLITYATQLESIDFEFDSYDPEVTKRYDQLIKEKKDILRKIGLNWTTRVVDCRREFGPQCVSYEIINLCTNLEELSGKLHLNEFQNIKTRLKRLSTGEIRNSVDFGMFAKLIRTNLEHIEIVKMQERWFAYFAQLKFPALRYLMIQFENYSDNQISNEEDVKTLVKNSPNLKAINFTGKPIPISEEFAFNIFETKGIIISLNDNIQEMADYFYKNQKDYLLFEKFKTTKNLYWKQFSKSECNKSCSICC